MSLLTERRVTIPELILVGGTRAAMGAGLGLLLGDRLSAEARKAAGWSLFLFGALTTIPLAFEVFGKRAEQPREARPEMAGAVGVG